MLRKIAMISPSAFSYCNIALILGFLCLLAAESGCGKRCISSNSEEMLKLRVQRFYDNWKSLKYSECIDFLSPDMKNDKEQILERSRKMTLKLVDYHIISIKMEGCNAAVTMSLTGIENGHKYTGRIVDFWRRTGEDWYMIDSGRAANKEDAVKIDSFQPPQLPPP